MQSEDPASLESNRADYVAIAAKGVLGAVPFAGSLLAEFAGSLIPKQRVDRIARFAAQLEARLSRAERDLVQQQMRADSFSDIIEETIRQASRAVSDDRLRYLASLLRNSIHADQINHLESKHLLRILGELTDIEVIWLRSYLNAAIGSDQAFRDRHREVLESVGAHMGSPQTELDRDAIQESYRLHLAQLGLIKPEFRLDSRTRQVQIDGRGHPVVARHAITPLGRLLLRTIDFLDG